MNKILFYTVPNNGIFFRIFLRIKPDTKKNRKCVCPKTFYPEINAANVGARSRAKRSKEGIRMPTDLLALCYLLAI